MHNFTLFDSHWLLKTLCSVSNYMVSIQWNLSLVCVCVWTSNIRSVTGLFFSKSMKPILDAKEQLTARCITFHLLLKCDIFELLGNSFSTKWKKCEMFDTIFLSSWKLWTPQGIRKAVGFNMLLVLWLDFLSFSSSSLMVMVAATTFIGWLPEFWNEAD